MSFQAARSHGAKAGPGEERHVAARRAGAGSTTPPGPGSSTPPGALLPCRRRHRPGLPTTICRPGRRRRERRSRHRRKRRCRRPARGCAPGALVPHPPGLRGRPPGAGPRWATSRSEPFARSYAHRDVAGSSPAGERKKTTRSPSGETVKLRGAPKENGGCGPAGGGKDRRAVRPSVLQTVPGRRGGASLVMWPETAGLRPIGQDEKVPDDLPRFRYHPDPVSTGR